uniref:Elongator complex protein 4 n=1 Tax=Tetraselmis sp. GSL018 TaxID=582737 RepID=A0A061RMG3_9CHLO|mmetsp:Transcript_8672/g.20904  ORF Transcript_8672/g.20904 Transcript_8672/m.20904 type:complete len:216 (-) Transcript_8672:71-718(-)
MGTSVGEEGLKQTGACLHVAECRGAEALREAEAHVCKNVEETMRALQPGAGRAGESPTVARVVVEDLGSPGWELGPGAAEGSLALLYRLRGLLRGTRCAAVVTVNPAHFPAGWCRRACHLADTVLSVEALHDDSVLVGLSPDPGTAVGRVSLLKSSPVGALGSAPAGAGGQQRLLRHRRRRLALEEISIDPDAEQALSEQPAGAASLGDGKQLDF